jgi:Amt family ammonium transporter
LVYGHARQLLWQLIAAGVGPAYAFVGTYVILRLLSLVIPLRVVEREEAIGLDVTQHGEEAYTTGEGAILVMPEAGIEADVPVRNP